MQKNYFAVLNPPKCIANLRTQPMHFKMNLEIYQTSLVMKEVVVDRLLPYITSIGSETTIKRENWEEDSIVDSHGISNLVKVIHACIQIHSSSWSIKNIQKQIINKHKKLYSAHAIRKIMKEDANLSYKKIFFTFKSTM